MILQPFFWELVLIEIVNLPLQNNEIWFLLKGSEWPWWQLFAVIIVLQVYFGLWLDFCGKHFLNDIFPGTSWTDILPDEIVILKEGFVVPRIHRIDFSGVHCNCVVITNSVSNIILTDSVILWVYKDLRFFLLDRCCYRLMALRWVWSFRCVRFQRWSAVREQLHIFFRGQHWRLGCKV